MGVHARRRLGRSSARSRFKGAGCALLWGTSFVGLLSCSDGGSPSDPDDDPDPDPEFVNADIWAAGMASPTLGIDARAASWEFGAQRETVITFLGTRPAFIGVISDTLVYATDNSTALRFRVGASNVRSVPFPAGGGREVEWFADAGDGRVLADLGGMLYLVDHRAGAVLDSLAIPPTAVTALHEGDVFVASQGTGSTLSLWVIRNGDTGTVDRFDTDVECAIPRDLVVLPEDHVAVLCIGNGVVSGSVSAVSAADGSVLGQVAHDQLGSTFQARQSQMAWVPTLNRVVVVTRELEMLLYDPATIRFAGSMNPAGPGGDGVRAASVVYHPGTDRVIVARHPFPFRVEGPFDLAILNRTGVEQRTFGSELFTPVWLAVRP